MRNRIVPQKPQTEDDRWWQAFLDTNPAAKELVEEYSDPDKYTPDLVVEALAAVAQTYELYKTRKR